MKPKSRHRIAVVLPIGPEYANRLYEGAIRYAGEHRHITLVDLTYTQAKGSPLPKGALPFEGALTWLGTADTWVDRLVEEGVAVVSASGDTPNKRVTVVALDREAMFEAALDHLMPFARPYAAYIGFSGRESSGTRWRQDQFLKRFTKHGMGARVFDINAETTSDGGEDSVTLLEPDADRLRQFLGEQPLPAVVWCASDLVGLHVCRAAAGLGIRVPGDLAVLGCGDLREARICRPTLSSIPLPGQVVGYEALAVLDRTLNGQAPTETRIGLAPPPVVQRESTTGASHDIDPIAAARRFIAEHACRGLTVNELMETVLMSQPTFTQRFRAAFGCSPAEEIRRVRIQWAMRYLRDHGLTISRVAGLCGYNQQCKFSNFFKRETGMTPREYRNRQRSRPSPT
jgi:LacI family transcriptional regulator